MRGSVTRFLLAAVVSVLFASAAYSGGEELKKLLPEEQHGAAEFILKNMPDRDRAELKPEFLAENIDYAYRARGKFAWAKDVPDEIFLNYVLPYACLNERRDAWRKQFFERFSAMVADCKTAGEAAIKLNKGIYDELKVHYSKERPKADQSPLESIEAGKASCTGLSILLVDACRAVGVPARVVGTPLWVGTGGNHTWVEVWDDGWHSIGASESSALDKTWFGKKAAGQIASDPKHAIYAASFAKTGLSFPLVFAPSVKYVNAVNVTARYVDAVQETASMKEVEQCLSDGKLSELLLKLQKKDLLINASDLDAITNLLWNKHAEAVKADPARKAEHEKKAVTYDGMTMRYAYKAVGKKTEEGYPLYIAMHGGGGAPARVNDSQWEHMKVYYLNGVTNGVYLAPRGVNDAWNLHWVTQSFACYERIIENMIVYEGVDPNRVYLMGYSAGGDAAYQIPARMPDRWAAAAMSAGHPNGVPPDNYANLAFLIQVGEMDAAYKRNTVAAEYGVKIDGLAKDHPGLYRHATYIHAGRGHGFMDHGGQGTAQKVFADPAEWLEKGSKAQISEVDCNSIRWLDQFVRDPVPGKVIWDCATDRDRSGGKQPGFWPTAEKGNLYYWLGKDRYDKDVELDAKRIVVELDTAANLIDVKEVGNFVRFYLKPGMLDLNKDVTVNVAGKTVKARPKLSLRVLVQTMLDRGDPNYVFPACLTLSRNPEGTWMLE